MDRIELYQFLVAKVKDLFVVSEIMGAIDSYIKNRNEENVCESYMENDEYAFMSVGYGVDEDYGGYEM